MGKIPLPLWEKFPYPYGKNSPTPMGKIPHIQDICNRDIKKRESRHLSARLALFFFIHFLEKN